MMAIVATSNVACTVQQAATPIESSEPATPQEASATITRSKVSPTAKPTPTNTPLPDPLLTDLEPFVATKAPVLPADATLTGITYYLQSMNDIYGNLLDVPQHEERLQISCEVTYGFDHLTELGPGIAEYAPEEPSTSTRDSEKPASIVIKAGDVIGYTTVTIVAHSWDFIFSNTAVVNSFANLERCENTGDLKVLLYAECPYDYFANDMGDEYRASIGGSNSGSTDSYCRTSYDVPEGIYGGLVPDYPR